MKQRVTGEIQRRTNFWAENMEFINGMYDVERSGDTERMRMRGSRWSARSVGALADFGGCNTRLMSCGYGLGDGQGARRVKTHNTRFS